MRELYLFPEFLTADECDLCRRAMDAGESSAAEVLDDSGTRVDTARRAGDVEVAPEVLALVEARLDRQREEVGRHFGVALTGREGSGFVRYPVGGFYRRHVDRADAPGWPAAAVRRVSAVIFLGSARSVDPAGDFAGGVLRLYPPGEEAADVVPRRGLLVAFPATVPHEVMPVRSGVRDAIVDWFR